MKMHRNLWVPKQERQVIIVMIAILVLVKSSTTCIWVAKLERTVILIIISECTVLLLLARVLALG